MKLLTKLKLRLEVVLKAVNLLIGRDFLPTGHQDYIARVFETKEEAIDYLKSISYIASGVHGNDWVYQNEKLPEIESRCRIWKVGE